MSTALINNAFAEPRQALLRHPSGLVIRRAIPDLDTLERLADNGFGFLAYENELKEYGIDIQVGMSNEEATSRMEQFYTKKYEGADMDELRKKDEGRDEPFEQTGPTPQYSWRRGAAPTQGDIDGPIDSHPEIHRGTDTDEAVADAVAEAVSKVETPGSEAEVRRAEKEAELEAQRRAEGEEEEGVSTEENDADDDPRRGSDDKGVRSESLPPAERVGEGHSYGKYELPPNAPNDHPIAPEDRGGQGTKDEATAKADAKLVADGRPFGQAAIEADRAHSETPKTEVEGDGKPKRKRKSEGRPEDGSV